MRPRNDDGAADAAARIVKLILRLLDAERIRIGIVGIQRIIAGRHKRIAVEAGSACFRHRGDHHRALLFLGAEVGSQNSELLQEIGVGIYRRITVTAGVGHMGSIGHDVECIARQAVVGESVIQGALTAGIAVSIDADGLTAVVRLVGRSVLHREAGHDLDVFGRVAAHLHVILELLGG